jgi:hypothetical protein
MGGDQVVAADADDPAHIPAGKHVMLAEVARRLAAEEEAQVGSVPLW